MPEEIKDIEDLADAEAVRTWLRQLRERAGLSQKQAAEAASTAEREIRRWENESAPGGVNLLRLLSAYGVKVTPSPPAEVMSVSEEIRRLHDEVASRHLLTFRPNLDLLTSREREIFHAWGRMIAENSIEAEEAAMAELGLSADEYEDAYNAIVKKVFDHPQNRAAAEGLRQTVTWFLEGMPSFMSREALGIAAGSAGQQDPGDRLESLRATVEAQGEAMTKALKALQRANRELARRLPPEAQPTKKAIGS